MMNLNILSAGAAKSLVTSLQSAFCSDAGVGVEGSYGAVGAVHEKFLAGEPCDVVVLTDALIAALADSGQVLAGSGVPLGKVRTGIAVHDGAPLPDIADRAALSAALLAAQEIYVSDVQRSTAGIHFANVLRRLGIHEQVEARLRAYPNGAVAMAELAKAAAGGPAMARIGCTQITEIVYTGGVTLVGPLPPEFELSTVYSVAVSSKAAQPELAKRLIALLTSAQSQALRTAGGFEA
ncbi:ABC transporter substrate-binding protein [Oxalobacteraceae bacterium CAVE-383]|nr:ABC transporter substrate-binding protein [Oxalobacteraceae bacterium CAVE-383]